MPQVKIGVIGGTGLYDMLIKHSGYRRIMKGRDICLVWQVKEGSSVKARSVLSLTAK